MLYGIGTDILNINQIESSVSDRQDPFVRKIYTPAEIELIESRPLPLYSYATRFAGKEAVFKALRWELVLVPTSIASSNPDDSVAIFKYDPFLKASAEVSVRWIRCRLLFHHQHRMVF